MKVDKDAAYELISRITEQIISDVESGFFDYSQEECRVCSILNAVIANDGDVPEGDESIVNEYIQAYGLEEGIVED